jgi:hypothetical protein
MTTQLPSQAIDPSLKDGDPLPPFDRDLVPILAAVASWLLGWPIFVAICAPLFKDANAFLFCLFGAFCLVWFMSCLAVCIFISIMVEDARRRSPSLYRSMAAVITGWFFGFPVVLSFLPNDAPVVIEMAGIAACWVWLASGYWIYDTLLTMTGARWPVVKRIREIVSAPLKALLSARRRSSG